MELIRGVLIENFRSIRNLRLRDLSEYNPIIGLNSSGKSNFLRALNLFFTGVIDDEGRTLDLGRDYSDHAPSGKKKVVTVGVELSLSPNFKVRGQDDFRTKHNLTDVIAIQRTWSLDQATNSLVETLSFGPDLDNLSVALPEDAPSVLAHVRAVIFRYIPNHTKPSALIAAIVQPLRAELVARLRGTKEYKDNSLAEVMGALERMGDRMFDDVSKRVHRGVPNLEVAPTLPRDFAELAFDVSVSSISDGKLARDPELEGSGTQAFMLLHFLDLADRAARRSGFGWVQASVWAIEEPESFLHSGLRARFSSDLAEYALDENRQVFLTTHQDEFVRVGTHAFFAARGVDGTTVTRMNTREALRATEKSAITTYRHPLLVRTDLPLILTEGEFDKLYLEAAIREANLRPRWRLASPEDEIGKGIGGDSLKKYLSLNRPAIASRPDPAPIIVLRDWEAKDAGDYDKILSDHAYSRCLTCPESLSNPDLGTVFVGIERYLETDLVLDRFSKREISRTMSKPTVYSVARATFVREKAKMAAAVRGGAPVGDHMVALVRWLDDQVVRILEEVPASEFVG